MARSLKFFQVYSSAALVYTDNPLVQATGDEDYVNGRVGAVNVSITVVAQTKKAALERLAQYRLGFAAAKDLTANISRDTERLLDLGLIGDEGDIVFCISPQKDRGIVRVRGEEIELIAHFRYIDRKFGIEAV